MWEALQLKNGRLIVDEPTTLPDGTEVDLVSRDRVPEAHPTIADMLSVVATFPAGTRTKEDIDRQIAAERSGWDRG